MNYSSSVLNGATNTKPDNASTVWQEIVSSDAKFNLYRINTNSQLSKKSSNTFAIFILIKFWPIKGTLYMRRRTQLLRDNAMKFREDKEIINLRRQYLNLRNQILEKKYGNVDQMFVILLF